MIDSRKFLDTFEILCRRFGRNVDRGEASLYLAFLRYSGLSDSDLQRAAATLWATREFFPRPVDFLLVGRQHAWEAVRDALQVHSPAPGGESGWGRLREAGDTARGAVEDLGGLSVLAREWERSPFRVRDRFMDAYELRILDGIRSHPTPLVRPPEPPPKRVGSGGGPKRAGEIVGEVMQGIVEGPK